MGEILSCTKHFKITISKVIQALLTVCAEVFLSLSLFHREVKEEEEEEEEAR
jgi:hypothetical protein